MNAKPLLSIVVPTKNRYYYLEFFVNYFHSIQSDEIELIIQDNSDLGTNTGFILFLDTIDDPRISYAYTSDDISVVENCDFGIARSKGEYVTLIGDDDIFSKHLLDYVEVCKNNSVDAILPIKGIYTWPDVQPRFYKNNLSGQFRVANFSGKSKQKNVISIQKKVLKLGGTDILDLPRVYHGIVKSSLLNKVYADSGSFFPGPSPDMANAIALCKYVTNYIVLDVPLIVSGHSVTSAGGQGAQGQHYGDISKIKHLPKDTAANWNSKVPFYWSGNTIYAESVIQALKRMKMEHYLKDFDFEYLYASCYVFDPKFKIQISNTISSQYRGNSILKRLMISFYIMKVWSKRIAFHLNNNLSLLLPGLFKQKNTLFQKNNIFDVAILNDELIDRLIEKRNFFKL
jgi:hypothetical protein